MPRKGAISQGGYTWWTKDWNSSDEVFELNLAERGLYRELIDLAMINDNAVEVKLGVWVRKFNSTREECQEIITRLLELNLIEETQEGKIFIPSCEKRLALIRAGASGGKASGKPLGKPTKKQTETETETETERRSSKVDAEKSPFDDDVVGISIENCALKLSNNERTLDAIVQNQDYGPTFGTDSIDVRKNMFREVLRDFNRSLVEQGVYNKTPKDYIKHLHNWLRTRRRIDQHGRFPWQLWEHNEKGFRIRTGLGKFKPARKQRQN